MTRSGIPAGSLADRKQAPAEPGKTVRGPEQTAAPAGVADASEHEAGGLVYAGIGSRQTPAEMLVAMTELARELERAGWHLHSGGADGADTAFENGTTRAGRTVYLPWKRYNDRSGNECVTLTNSEQSHAQGIVSKYHGAWERCSRGARALHGRNEAIIHGLGHAPTDRRVDAVICWTPGGATQGGTATGMKMARTAGIPVLNLARVSAADALVTMHTIARKKLATG